MKTQTKRNGTRAWFRSSFITTNKNCFQDSLRWSSFSYTTCIIPHIYVYTFTLCWRELSDHWRSNSQLLSLVHDFQSSCQLHCNGCELCTFSATINSISVWLTCLETFSFLGKILRTFSLTCLLTDWETSWKLEKLLASRGRMLPQTGFRIIRHLRCCNTMHLYHVPASFSL